MGKRVERWEIHPCLRGDLVGLIERVSYFGIISAGLWTTVVPIANLDW